MVRDLLERAAVALNEPRRRLCEAAALLLLRVAVGGTMLLAHGWGKLLAFGERADTFPDPLGVGNPLSMALAVFAEVFCSLLVVLGLATRLALLPLIVTMLVALLIVHGADPWARKELAFMYLVPFVALLLAGPGPWSLDALILTRLRRSSPS